MRTNIITVDVAVIDLWSHPEVRILLGKKNQEPKYRLVGGCVEDKETLEDAAVRETKEETNVDFKELFFIESKVISDNHAPMKNRSGLTVLFAGLVEDIDEVNPKPGDDIHEVKWFDLHHENLMDEIMPEHKSLIDSVKQIVENTLNEYYGNS